MIAVVLLSITILLMCFILKKNGDGKAKCSTLDASASDQQLLKRSTDLETLPAPPGPKPLPFLGSLHLLAKHRIPFEAFTKLREEFGSVVSLKLGTTNCVVLQGEDSIHQALISKADHFDSRPNFVRFHLMFGGSKKNALAFCDYDDLQKVRKKILAVHTFPRYLSTGWRKLEAAFRLELGDFMDSLNESVDLKPLLSKACSNIFNNYFCDSARKPYSESGHSTYVKQFDRIFWEVNNGRLVDFIPELFPLIGANMRQVSSWCSDIRQYVTKNILDTHSEGGDNLLQGLLDRVRRDEDVQDDNKKLTLDCALYALEDILGGHCAVANTTLRMLKDICDNPEVQATLREEILSEAGDEEFRLERISNLQYLTACFYETLRLTSSAIVPHMANRDTSAGGFHIPENTVVFINNHYSNFSTEYWTDPEEYRPQRFIQNGRFKKPSHFLPFSTGRRSCIGYKMVQLTATSIVATILRRYVISCAKTELPVGMLALPPKPFYFDLRAQD